MRYEADLFVSKNGNKLEGKLVTATEDLFEAAANAADDAEEDKSGHDSHDDPSPSGDLTVGHFAGLVKGALLVSLTGSSKLVVECVPEIVMDVFDSFANVLESFLDFGSS
mgnify:FL=1